MRGKDEREVRKGGREEGRKGRNAEKDVRDGGEGRLRGKMERVACESCTKLKEHETNRKIL